MTAYPVTANASCWWLYRLTRSTVLHAVPADRLDENTLMEAIDEGLGALVVTACGRTMGLTMPGPLSRLGAPRCNRCCRRLGIPAGNGTPANQEVG